MNIKMSYVPITLVMIQRPMPLRAMHQVEREIILYKAQKLIEVWD